MKVEISERKRSIKLLSSLIGIDPGTIKNCLENSRYKKAEIPKKEKSKFRELRIPDERLMEVQRAILTSLLYRLPVSPVAYCSVPHRSIAEHISLHRQSKSFFKIDFEDAFPSISREMIIRHLIPMLEEHSYYSSLPREEIEESANLLSFLMTYEDALPQGAPTSPCLLNLVCYGLDQKILEITKKFNLLYSRYADDLMISSPESKIPKEARVAIVDTIKEWGFKINREKTTYKTGKATVPKITGVTLIPTDSLEVKPSLPRKKIEQYRKIIHNAAHNPDVKLEKVFGIMGWVKIATGGEIPSRLKEPFREFLEQRCPKRLPRYAHLLK